MGVAVLRLHRLAPSSEPLDHALAQAKGPAKPLRLFRQESVFVPQWHRDGVVPPELDRITGDSIVLIVHVVGHPDRMPGG